MSRSSVRAVDISSMSSLLVYGFTRAMSTSCTSRRVSFCLAILSEISVARIILSSSAFFSSGYFCKAETSAFVFLKPYFPAMFFAPTSPAIAQRIKNTPSAGANGKDIVRANDTSERITKITVAVFLPLTFLRVAELSKSLSEPKARRVSLFSIISLCTFLQEI